MYKEAEDATGVNVPCVSDANDEVVGGWMRQGRYSQQLTIENDEGDEMGK